MSYPVKQFQISKFDVSRIKKTHKCVFIGKSGSGKTMLMRHILAQPEFLSIPVGTVISQTEFVNRTFSEFVPSKFIHDEYRPDIIENAVKRQFIATKREKDELIATGQSTIDPHAFLILDDCLSSKAEMVGDKNIKYVFYAGRHIKLCFFLAMQYPLGLTPDLRTNIDFVFIFREANVQNRERIFQNYAGMFPTFAIFQQVLNQSTQNFECLVIDNTSPENRIDKQVYWYKASDPGPFRLCEPRHWVDNKPFRSSLAIANADEELDENEVRSRRGPVIKVLKSDKF